MSRSLSPTMVSEYNLKLIDKELLQKKLKEYVELAETTADVADEHKGLERAPRKKALE